MKEDLLNYMNRRSQKIIMPADSAGPIVSISREKGCPATTIVEKLTHRLSERKGSENWRWVNKEILEESARELHMNKSKINHVLHSEDKGFFRDLMLSFGERYYESDIKVKKTIAELISEFSTKGRVIIIGLGAVGITKNIDLALHIKLYAPYKYRLMKVERYEKLSRENAREFMDESDVNRKLLIDYFNGVKAGEDLFDVQFNCATMSENEIVQAIIEMMILKKLI